MPDRFHQDNTPAEFKKSGLLAEEQLRKLEDTDLKVLGTESSTLHLLSSGLTSQAKVLNTIIEKFDTLQLKEGQELGTELQQAFDRHVTVTRKLQKSAITTNLNDTGILPDSDNIQLICTLYTEDASPSQSVPEACVKNLKSFAGEGDVHDMDYKCEMFITEAMDIGLSNKLAHNACKSLILRKLSGYANLVLNTYLENQALTAADMTLTQLLGLLERTFRSQSTPEVALHRLQTLPEIKNRNYLQATGVIARLARLSTRLEPDTNTRKLIFQTRSKEYLLKSLQSDDRLLIIKEDAKRQTENREPLSFIAVSEYLTKYHQLKSKPLTDFIVNNVQTDNSHLGEQECEHELDEGVNYVFRNATGQTPYKNNYQKPGQFHNSRPPNAYNNTRNIAPRPPYNNFTNKPSPYTPRGTNRFSRGFPQNNQRRGFYNNNNSRFKSPQETPNTYNNRNNSFQNRGAFRGRFNSSNRPPQFDARNKNRGSFQQRGRPSSRGQNKFTPNSNRVTHQQLNLDPSQCKNCGSKKHVHTSDSCPYFPQQAQQMPCYRHNPARFGHHPSTCLGDFSANAIVQNNDDDHDSNF